MFNEHCSLFRLLVLGAVKMSRSLFLKSSLRLNHNALTFVNPILLQSLVVPLQCGWKPRALVGNVSFIKSLLPTTLLTVSSYPDHLTSLGVPWINLKRAPVMASGNMQIKTSMQHCPDITILVSHRKHNDHHHTRTPTPSPFPGQKRTHRVKGVWVIHWVSHEVGHGVNHEVSHEVNYWVRHGVGLCSHIWIASCLKF